MSINLSYRGGLTTDLCNEFFGFISSFRLGSLWKFSGYVQGLTSFTPGSSTSPCIVVLLHSYGYPNPHHGDNMVFNPTTTYGEVDPSAILAASGPYTCCGSSRHSFPLTSCQPANNLSTFECIRNTNGSRNEVWGSPIVPPI